MQCFDFKGGIGTASRVLPAETGYTVGALVLTNFGDREELRIDGVRVGEQITDLMPAEHTEGSCVVVVATDAALLPHQLRRVAQRAGLGLARTGSHASNGSGEQMLAFSTANRLAMDEGDAVVDVRAVADARSGEPWLLSQLFAATVEATEEAVVNALLAAETVVGRDGNTLYAMPADRVGSILAEAGRLVPR
jgi:D-aminopeptidase